VQIDFQVKISVLGRRGATRLSQYHPPESLTISMTAAILILLFAVLIIVLIANLSNGQQERQVQSAPRPIPTIRIPVTVTVSYDAPGREQDQAIEGEPADPEKLWIPPGESVSVKDYQIPGGMLYVGKNLPTRSGDKQLEPSFLSRPPTLTTQDLPYRTGLHIAASHQKPGLLTSTGLHREDDRREQA
jgi:hypothetical protein